MDKVLIPPHSEESEKAVLGAILVDSSAFCDVSGILTSKMFYNALNADIYKSFEKMFNAGITIDITTAISQIRKDGLTDQKHAVYLASLNMDLSSSINAIKYAQIIAEHYFKRNIIETGHKLLKDGYDEGIDAFEALDNADQLLNNVNSTLERGHTEDLMSLLDNHYKYKLENLENTSSGVTTQLEGLDNITNGFQKGELTILAARPAMGKTALSVSILLGAAKNSYNVAFFSLEMSKGQLLDRIMSHESGIPLENIRKQHTLDQDHLNRLGTMVNQVRELPMFIDDQGGLTITELKSKAYSLNRKHDIDIIVVDYLQLMKGQGNNREQEISKISNGLKNLAKDLDIPIIALSQLSRAVESRGGDKRPQLSDLRDSGSIEQDADIVIFLYRPEYYGIINDENGDSLEGIGYAIIAKNRQGTTGDVPLQFEGMYTRWRDINNNYF